MQDVFDIKLPFKQMNSGKGISSPNRIFEAPHALYAELKDVWSRITAFEAFSKIFLQPLNTAIQEIPPIACIVLDTLGLNRI